MRTLTYSLPAILIALIPALRAAAAVPKATCRASDRPETGLQGQITVEERTSGASEKAYTCNTELVGQYEGEGTSYQMASFGDCAYYMTANRAEQAHRGTVVVDVTDSRHPQLSEYLDSNPAMLYPHESLKVHEGRKLLAGVQGTGTGFAIYDLSTDCRHPTLKATLDIPGASGHSGNFSPDGKTYYSAQTFRGINGIMPIIDVADPANPRHIINWQFPGDGRPHDLSFSEDGMKAYSTQPGQPQNTTFPGPNGLVILDVSDIQLRRENPKIRIVGAAFWDDGAQAQMSQRMKINGKPYLIVTDELGSGGGLGKAWACQNGLPPFGYGRIVDISDETNPRIVSKLSLEVSEAANCDKTLPDPTSSFGYTSHYCTVDDEQNATMVACSYFEAGLRVFDIRDPAKPREIAYYKPPARRKQARPASTFYWSSGGPTSDRTADWASSNIRWRKDRSELWFTSHDNGLQVVKLVTSGSGGGCTSTGGAPGLLLLAGLLSALRFRRRRRT
jgi:uncharacterized protein (TIGR03382 family)